MNLHDIFGGSENLIRPDNSAEMVLEFIKNPALGQIVREASAVLLDAIDNNYLLKELSKDEEVLANIVKEKMVDRNPLMEVRLYKASHLIYAMIQTLEQEKVISILKPKTSVEKIKEQARQIFIDYKNKKR